MNDKITTPRRWTFKLQQELKKRDSDFKWAAERLVQIVNSKINDSEPNDFVHIPYGDGDGKILRVGIRLIPEGSVPTSPNASSLEVCPYATSWQAIIIMRAARRNPPSGFHEDKLHTWPQDRSLRIAYIFPGIPGIPQSPSFIPD